MGKPTPDRREVLHGLLLTHALALLPGCTVARPVPDWHGPPRSELIDVHCHVFNASDLPAERFLRIVLLELYPREAVSVIDVHNPDAVDGLIALMTWVLGRAKAPTADQEARLLDGGAAHSAAADASKKATAVKAAVAQFITQHSGAIGVAGSPVGRSESVIVDALFDAAGKRGPVAADTAPPSSAVASRTARDAYESKTDIGTYLQWFGLITHYRYALADQLVADHARQGFKAKLIVPALVDYDKWLGQNVTASPLPKQVEAMDSVSQRPDGPAVHGYVAFDPLRQAYHEAGLDAGFNPLDLVKLALQDKGFLGVKLYPPMGFKPIGNAAHPQAYPKDVTKALNGQVGPALDKALTQLFNLCSEMDAPVIAHANRSNGAGNDFADRADPAFWLPVFSGWSSLRVCLAHFGHFSAPSASAATITMPDGSWEWTLGGYIATHPDSHVYADISYLSEVFSTPEKLQAIAATVRAFVKKFDPKVEHLMFGTDWIMLGLEGGYPSYTGRIFDFFSGPCGFTAEQMQNLFHINAERFLGLERGTQSWKRLADYYVRNELPLARLQGLRLQQMS